ncbi:MAG: hypothetical protein J3Q66DRAFT_398902 [Benniella sp.]|nr:MAG: hypothetical protein J3Q66DRAFT_398902 [Benniella sp.]
MNNTILKDAWPHPQGEAVPDDELSKTRHEVDEMLESKRAHVVILSLTILDVLLVICQIAATLLGFDHSKESEWALELFAHASLAIVMVFLLEIFLKLFAFVFLKGAEQELGSLIIIFRLWRIIKLTGMVTIKTAEQSQSLVEEMQERIQGLELRLSEAKSENRRLRAIIGEQSTTEDDKSISVLGNDLSNVKDSQNDTTVFCACTFAPRLRYHSSVE